MKIIDFHVNVLPEWARESKPSWISEENEILQRNYNHKDIDRIHNNTCIDKLLFNMQNNKIDKCVIFGYPWLSKKRCIDNNKYTANLLKKYPNKFIGLASMYVDAEYNEVYNYAVECLTKDNFSGFKIKPQWQNWSLSDISKIKPVVDAIRDTKKGFILTHVSQCFKKPEGDSCYEVIEFLKEYNDIKIVLAHMGGMLPFYNVYKPISKLLKNVYIDISLKDSIELIPSIINIFDEDKILFATDYPYGSFDDFLTKVNKLNLDEKIKEKILYKNAETLLNNS